MKKHLKLTVALITVAAVLCSLIFFILYWFFDDEYSDFDNFKKDFAIPALDDGFIPQGLGNYSDGGVFLVSGYMNDGGASRIYVIENGVETGYVTVHLDDGETETDEGSGEVTVITEPTVYYGHACGVATNGTKVWLVSESTVYTLTYSDVIDAAKENASVTITGSFDAWCGADFCYYYENYLYVGEFYRSGNYETAAEHRVTSYGGDSNTAVIIKFSASSSSPNGVALSITGEIQGMAITEDSSGTQYFTLSQSYGLKNSHILTYKYNTSHSASVTFLNSSGTEKSFTLYYLDSSNLVSDLSVPCMSEGLCTDGNTVYVLFESAGAKYKLYVRERLENVYSIKNRYLI